MSSFLDGFGPEIMALSLRQPWAFVVAAGWKDIENRTWRTPFRGPFLVHASKGFTKQEWVAARDWMMDAGLLAGGRELPSFEALEIGGIVGRATLVDIVDRCAPKPKREAFRNGFATPMGFTPSCRVPGHASHMPDQIGFRLADARAIPLVPCAGALQFFRAPAKVVETLRGMP